MGLEPDQDPAHADAATHPQAAIQVETSVPFLPMLVRFAELYDVDECLDSDNCYLHESTLCPDLARRLYVLFFCFGCCSNPSFTLDPS